MPLAGSRTPAHCVPLKLRENHRLIFASTGACVSFADRIFRFVKSFCHASNGFLESIIHREVSAFVSKRLKNHLEYTPATNRLQARTTNRSWKRRDKFFIRFFRRVVPVRVTHAWSGRSSRPSRERGVQPANSKERKKERKRERERETGQPRGNGTEGAKRTRW